MPILQISTPLSYAILSFVCVFFFCLILLLLRGYQVLLNMSIFYKFMGSVLLISLIPLLVFSLSRYKALGEFAIEKDTEKLSAIADLKVEIILNYFNELEADIKNIQNSSTLRINAGGLDTNFESSEYQKVKETIDTTLVKYVQNEKILDLLVLNSEFEIVYTTENVSEFKQLGEKISYIGDSSKYFSEKDVVFSDVFEKEDEGYLVMFISAPVLQDSFEGHVVFVVDMRLFNDQIQETAGLGKTGETVLGKKFGDEVIILNELRNQEDGALNIKIKMGEDIAIPLQKSSSKESGEGLAIDYRGKQVLSVWRYIPLLDWGLVVKMDYEEVTKPVSELRNALVVFLSIVVASVVLFSYLMSKLILDRLKNLAEIMKDMDEGLPINWFSVKEGGRDEVGRLIISVKKMVSNMSVAQVELQKRLDELHRFTKVTVGRELRMAELKKEIAKLKKEDEKIKN